MGGNQDEVNANMRRDQLAAQKEQNALLKDYLKPQAGQIRHEQGANQWFEHLKGKDFSKPFDGPGSLLSFNLQNQDFENDQAAKYANLSGVGAAALQGGGSTPGSHIAVQQSRDRNARAAGQRQAQGYEDAYAMENQYWRTGEMPWTQLRLGQLQAGVSNASQREQFYGGQYAKTATQSIWPSVIGGAAGAVGGMIKPFSI